MPRRIIFCSGAGASVAAGIPTFRDANGLWANHKVEDVCNYKTWRANFELVHKFYEQRRKEIWDCIPTRFHKMVAKLQYDFGSQAVCNITTNVDDLFEKAGCLRTTHLHGEIKAMSLDWEEVRDGNASPIMLTKAEFDYSAYPKSKPYVVFFNEGAPEYGKMWNLAAEITPDDLVIIVGSSEQVISFRNEFYNANQIWFVNPAAKSIVRPTEYDVKAIESNAEDFAQNFEQEIRNWLHDVETY